MAKPEYVRALTYEEMSPAQREMYTPHRRQHDPYRCQCEYDILARLDDEIPSFHRPKDD